MNPRDIAIAELESNEFEKLIQQIQVASNNGMIQVQHCLNQVERVFKKDKSQPRKANRFYEYVKSHSIYIEWGDKEKQRFNIGFDVLYNWKDFFFSYTTRDQKSKNYIYETLINDYKKHWDDPWLESLNSHKLAYIIHKKIRRNNLESFIDVGNITSGKPIQQAVENACESAFVFVQLIEEASFIDQADEKNWCFFEYCSFKENNKLSKIIDINKIEKRIHFIVLSKSLSEIQPANSNGYEEWMNDIKNFRSVCVYNEICREELKTKLRNEQIASNIMDDKKKIIDLILEYRPI